MDTHRANSKNNFLAKETKRLHRNLSSVQSPVLIFHEATVERNNSLWTGRNLWQNQTQEGWPSVSTSWGLRGQKRGDNEHRNTIERIPVETWKHKLMTTVMPNVHSVIWGHKRGEKRENWGKVRHKRPPQQSRPIAKKVKCVSCESLFEFGIERAFEHFSSFQEWN